MTEVITSGAITINHPFMLAVSGSLVLGAVSSSQAIIVCNSGEVSWVEQKDAE